MIKIRTAFPSDYGAIARLHMQSWRENYRGIYTDQFLDLEVEKDRMDTWQRRFQAPESNQQVFIAEKENGFVAGFVCLYVNDDPVYGSLIDNLHVSKEMKSKGIGKILVQKCADYIFEKSSSRNFYLWVYEANLHAIAFYERIGGEHLETVEKENQDGTVARVCRYIWR